MSAALPATEWDPSLCEAMTEAGVAVFEEELRLELFGAMRSTKIDACR